MNWLEIKVIYHAKNTHLAGELISGIFYDTGFKGIVVEDPNFEETDGIWDDTVIIPNHYAITGYLPQNKTVDKKCLLLNNAIAALEKDEEIQCRTVYRKIDEEDWAESWKTFFGTEKIGKNIVVKPTWQEYSPENDDIIVEIDPGMAFGSGTHQTTSLCICMIEKYLKSGSSFLDVGTGSGILMVAAYKLGANHVCGIDTDEIAVEIAKKNLTINQVPEEKFVVSEGNLVEIIDQKFDLVVANILSEIIIELLDSITPVLAGEGTFICSGIVEKNRVAVIEKMKEKDFEILDVMTKESWVAIAGKLS